MKTLLVLALVVAVAAAQSATLLGASNATGIDIMITKDVHVGTSVCADPDDPSYIYAIDADGMDGVWVLRLNLTTGLLASSVEYFDEETDPEGHIVDAAAIACHGRYVWVATLTRVVTLYRATPGQLLLVDTPSSAYWISPATQISSMLRVPGPFGSDKIFVVSGSPSNEISIWARPADLNETIFSQSLVAGSDGAHPNSMAWRNPPCFTADGNVFATGTGDGYFELWSALYPDHLFSRYALRNTDAATFPTTMLHQFCAFREQEDARHDDPPQLYQIVAMPGVPSSTQYQFEGHARSLGLALGESFGTTGYVLDPVFSSQLLYSVFTEAGVYVPTLPLSGCVRVGRTPRHFCSLRGAPGTSPGVSIVAFDVGLRGADAEVVFELIYSDPAALLPFQLVLAPDSSWLFAFDGADRTLFFNVTRPTGTAGPLRIINDDDPIVLETTLSRAAKDGIVGVTMRPMRPLDEPSTAWRDLGIPEQGAGEIELSVPLSAWGGTSRVNLSLDLVAPANLSAGLYAFQAFGSFGNDTFATDEAPFFYSAGASSPAGHVSLKRWLLDTEIFSIDTIMVPDAETLTVFVADRGGEFELHGLNSSDQLQRSVSSTIPSHYTLVPLPTTAQNEFVTMTSDSLLNAFFITELGISQTALDSFVNIIDLSGAQFFTWQEPVSTEPANGYYLLISMATGGGRFVRSVRYSSVGSLFVINDADNTYDIPLDPDYDYPSYAPNFLALFPPNIVARFGFISHRIACAAFSESSFSCGPVELEDETIFSPFRRPGTNDADTVHLWVRHGLNEDVEGLAINPGVPNGLLMVLTQKGVRGFVPRIRFSSEGAPFDSFSLSEVQYLILDPDGNCYDWTVFPSTGTFLVHCHNTTFRVRTTELGYMHSPQVATEHENFWRVRASTTRRAGLDGAEHAFLVVGDGEAGHFEVLRVSDDTRTGDIFIISPPTDSVFYGGFEVSFTIYENSSTSDDGVQAVWIPSSAPDTEEIVDLGGATYAAYSVSTTFVFGYDDITGPRPLLTNGTGVFCVQYRDAFDNPYSRSPCINLTLVTTCEDQPFSSQYHDPITNCTLCSTRFAEPRNGTACFGCAAGFFHEDFPANPADGRCAWDAPTCRAQRCSGRGDCLYTEVNSLFAPQCACDAGYFGRFCEQTGGQCRLSRCSGLGACVNETTGCACDDGASGANCSTCLGNHVFRRIGNNTWGHCFSCQVGWYGFDCNETAPVCRNATVDKCGDCLDLEQPTYYIATNEPFSCSCYSALNTSAAGCAGPDLCGDGSVNETNAAECLCGKDRVQNSTAAPLAQCVLDCQDGSYDADGDRCICNQGASGRLCKRAEGAFVPGGDSLVGLWVALGAFFAVGVVGCALGKSRSDYTQV